MAYRSYSQTPFNIALVMLGEYGKKFSNFVLFLIRYSLLFVIVSTFLGLYVALKCEPRICTFFDCLTFGSWLLLDFFPAPEEATDSFQQSIEGYLWVCRFFGFIISGLFAGVSVSIFLEPANSISFSKYVVIDLEQKRIRFRYWVRKTEQHFLYDAQIELLIMDESEAQNGSTETRYRFRYREPENATNIPVDRYTAIRGVRSCDIPFDQKSSSDPNTSMQEVLLRLLRRNDDPDEKEPSQNTWRLLFRVVGTDEDGRVVYRDYTYRECNILCGYDFLSIRRDEILREAQEKRGTDVLPKSTIGVLVGQGALDSEGEELSAFPVNLQKRKNKQLFHEHFNVVLPNRAESENPFEGCAIVKNKPMDVYYSETLDCVARGFRLRECTSSVRQDLSEKISRCKKTILVFLE